MKGIARHTEALIKPVSPLDCLQGWVLVGGTTLAIQHLIRRASFRYKTCLEQIDYAITRGIDHNQMSGLHRWSSSVRNRTSSS